MVKSLFKKFIIFGIVLMFLFMTSIAGVIYSFYQQLPYVSLENYEQSVNSKIYDEKGRLILELFKDENRTRKVKLNEISKHVVSAVVSIEDKRFYNHYGIDIKRIIKSALYILQHGRKGPGGSTITQQLARNAYLSLDKKWSRKIKEILLSFKLEKQFTKPEILEMYLNEVPFGEGAYGIESASRIFFGKHANELSISESALLAGVIQLPYRYTPFKYYDRAIKRRNIVLNEMYKNGYITEEECEKAKSEELSLVGKKRHLCKAPYYIYSKLLPELKEKYGENTVNSGGLKIQTTINLDIQTIVEEEFSNAEIFNTYPDLNGALLVVEVKTGKILAMAGGKEFSESDQFNRVYNAIRQPGSLMKPIVYLTGFDNGISPNKIFSDVPREYFDPWTQTIWQPQNYGGRYHGPVILRMALANSYNIVAIELLKEVGIKNVIDYAKKLGIKSRLRETLSLALGAYSVNPIEMAKVYSVFANSGNYIKFSDILKVTDINGFDIEKYVYSSKKVVNPASVSILNSVLKAVIQNGSGTRAKIPGYNMAGKTGTTDDYTNAWFCGYSPNLLVISYLGYDYPKTIGENCSGGRITAPIVKNVIQKIIKKFPERFPSEPFSVPDELTEIEICRESGLLKSDDCVYTVKQLFYKGTGPKLKCNFHAPDMFEIQGFDTQEIRTYFDKENTTRIMDSPQEKTENSAKTGNSLNVLKNELNFFGD